MGFSRSFYQAYGVRLPDDYKYDLELLDRQLAGSGCSYLVTNQATEPVVFLTISGTTREIEPGRYQLVTEESFTHQTGMWDGQLTASLAVIGVTPDENSGWLFVADLS